MPSVPELPDFPASQLFLRRLAYSLVRDEARADDLVQETWAAWIEHGPRRTRAPRAWLARVLRNRAFNLKRSEAHRNDHEACAGRPDPTAPETEGTLEAQAHLLDALRRLDEPYRSTLVQRYYHDLAPRAIAERGGISLNTVKARLARGLTRLREALDHRYHGDRSAWCHWLAPVGLVAIPWSAGPAPSAPGAGGGVGGTGIAAGTKLLWFAALAAVAAIVGLRGEDRRGSRGAEPGASPAAPPVPIARIQVPGSRDEGSERGAAGEGGGRGLSRAHPAPAVAASEPEAEPEPQDSPGYVAQRGTRETFEWPQYAGAATHAFPSQRDDRLQRPAVLWRAAAARGQPSLSKGELYSGGPLPMRLDPASGALLGIADDVAERLVRGLIEAPIRPLAIDAAALAQRIGPATLGAPGITGKAVLFRTADGFVSAYDRTLTRLLWRWVEPVPQPTSWPGCLARDDLYVMAFGMEVIALDVRSGAVKWRFDAGERVDMVPCSDGRRVFFGGAEAPSLFRALDVFSGAPAWEYEVILRGTQHALVHAGFVLAATRGEGARPGPEGRLVKLDAVTGKELWSVPFAGEELPVPALRIEGYNPDLYVGLGGGFVSLALGDGALQNPRVAGSGPFRCPTWVSAKYKDALVFASADGSLCCEDGYDDWAFRPPAGVEIGDFVHTGTRVYASSNAGLFCIGEGTRTRAQAFGSAGTQIEWEGVEGSAKDCAELLGKAFEQQGMRIEDGLTR